MFLIVSCTSDKATNKELLSKSFQDLMNLEIGKLIDDEIVLDIRNQDLMEKFQDYTDRIKLDVKPTNVEILTLDSNHYLRFQNSNNSFSTIALITVFYPNLEKPYIGVELGSTICTSLICAGGGGCLPNGDYCTQCEKDADSDVPTDSKCTRSTSN
jgi:hypothetical protein